LINFHSCRVVAGILFQIAVGTPAEEPPNSPTDLHTR
jgi:hypothetical protein